MSEGEFAIRVNVQLHGVLHKKPFSKHTSKHWTKRFVILKDSFLLYYQQSEAKSFLETGIFNNHPKGVIPLGGCLVSPAEEESREFAFTIDHPDFGGNRVVMAADSEANRTKWIDTITECSRVTFKQTLLGDTMIKCLQAKTNVINDERKVTEQKLAEGEEALREEKELRERIEAELEALKREREEKERIQAELTKQQEAQEKKLKQTEIVILKIQEQKELLEAREAELASKVEEYSREVTTLSTEAELERQRMIEEQEALAEATEQLISSLQEMETKATSLEEKRHQTEEKLLLAEKEVSSIAEKMSVQEGLQSQLQEQLTQQEAEKKEALTRAEREIAERRRLEKKLKIAEDSLMRLDRALRESGVKASIDVQTDVRQLKGFFEEVLDDHFWEAQKSVIMEKAVKARPEYESV